MSALCPGSIDSFNLLLTLPLDSHWCLPTPEPIVRTVHPGQEIYSQDIPPKRPLTPAYKYLQEYGPSNLDPGPGSSLSEDCVAHQISPGKPYKVRLLSMGEEALHVPLNSIHC